MTSAGPPAATLSIPGVEWLRDVRVSMRDGAQLAADVYLPRDGRPVPALVHRTPYGRRWSVTEAYAHPAWYAARGFAVICQDVRGRGESPGDFVPYASEALDGADTIEWAASQPWCSGAVGMYGFSYPGAIQLLAAAERPRGLRAIAPAMAPATFHSPWTYRGGAFQLAWVLRWLCDLGAETATRVGDAGAAARFAELAESPQRLFGALPVLDAFPPELRAHVPYLGEWLAHSEDGPYWRQTAARESLHRVEVPVLSIGGWYDAFLEGTVEVHERLVDQTDSPHMLAIGPWPHVPWQRCTGGIDFGPDAGSPIDELQAEFFRRWLYEEPNGVECAPVRLFVMGENGWRTLPRWSSNAADPIVLYLHSDGRANSLAGTGALARGAPRRSQAPDIVVCDPTYPVAPPGGRSCCYPEITPMGPADQRCAERRNDVLVYDTPPLREDILVIGRPSATLTIASDAPSADVVVRLCDVDDTGRSLNISDGNLRTPVDGRPRTVEIPMSPTAVCFRAGHRIRLDVAGSSFPLLDRNPHTGQRGVDAGPSDLCVATHLLFHDPDRSSRVTLPVVHGR
jgi:putative CocE/NonD family hydrolase